MYLNSTMHTPLTEGSRDLSATLQTPGSPTHVSQRTHAIINVEMVDIKVHVIFFLFAMMCSLLLPALEGGGWSVLGRGTGVWELRSQSAELELVNLTEQGRRGTWSGSMELDSPPTFASDAYVEWSPGICNGTLEQVVNLRARFMDDSGNVVWDEETTYSCWNVEDTISIPPGTADGGAPQPSSGRLWIHIDAQVIEGPRLPLECGGTMTARRMAFTALQCVLRIVMGAACARGLWTYHKRCRASTEALRPEHGLIFVLYCSLIVLFNPFCVLLAIPRTGTVADIFLSMLLFHLPLVFFFVYQGVFWGVLASLSSAAKGAPDKECVAVARRRWVSWLAVHIALDVTFSFSRGRPLTSIAKHGTFGAGVDGVAFIATFVYTVLQLFWLLFVALPWCCCCAANCFGPM
eukprot:Hpha_TRINITY_DN14271_c0_g2::TRINITY_DN14271_c0_g2_i1::g.22514::m.22514